MSDHTDTLTDTERARIADSMPFPTTDKEWATLIRNVESIVAARVAAARADERAKMTLRLASLADSARVALSGPPTDCTNACMDGPCNCSGNFRALAWDIDPQALRALIEGADQ